jgi:hypothetical protein
MELYFKSLFGLNVHTDVLIGTPAFGLVNEGAVGKPR